MRRFAVASLRHTLLHASRPPDHPMVDPQWTLPDTLIDMGFHCRSPGEDLGSLGVQEKQARMGQ